MKGSVNIFGGKGQIGSYFATRSAKPVVLNDKYDLVPRLAGVSDVLYMISTVDNYNVFTNPHLDVDTNLTTLIRVLENFRLDNRQSIFNFVSSWFVYGDTDLPAKETSYCNPRGFYSITKRAAEQLLISYCETYKLPYRILRFANVVGNHDTGFSKKKNALTFMLNDIKQNKPINLYDGGEFYRDFIHIDDLCDAVNLVLEKGNVNEIYNIGNGQAISFKTVIDYAINKYSSKSPVIDIDQPEFHKKVQVKSMYLDITKLKELGYEPKRSVYTFIDKFK